MLFLILVNLPDKPLNFCSHIRLTDRLHLSRICI